jgi:methylamine dehydrogenase heavy chain
MAPVEPEEPFTHKLPEWSPHWGFVRGGWENGGTRIWNGDTGKMVGLVSTGRWSDLALDPKRRFIYVSESIWTKVNRGTRQDMISVYDSVNMALVTEIPLPGRLIIGTMKNNFVISDDGKTGFVYDFSPASSVIVVDLEKRKVGQVVELPGCASLVPVTGIGFSALCSDGTIATVTVGPKTSTVSHSQPFFKAAEDGVFDFFTYDRTKGEIVTLTYTGLIRTVKLGAAPTGEDLSSQGLRLLDRTHDLFEVFTRNKCTLFRRLIERISGLKRADPCSESVTKPVVDLSLHEDSRTAEADLALIGK